MNRTVYMALAKMCGSALLHVRPRPYKVDPDVLPAASCAVYAAVDSREKVCYVGSVYRPSDPQGLASHVREYLHENPKTVRWSKIYVLPLRPGMSEKEVRRIGGEIVGWLLPYDRERWPQAS
ncbi:hypothetical protein [Nonomuraea wenchangensis]|uniref:hypothetical protein n=1 Tax=Nonomuraea wenchangensis TaxID=568860 RepID=UPI003324C36F